MTTAEIAAFLETELMAVLTTLDRRGYPHSVRMYHVPTADHLEMWTYGKSQKAANLRRDPRFSILAEAGEPYVDVKGVLIQGEAEVIDDDAATAAIGRRLYERCFMPTTGIPYDQGPNLEIERQAIKRVGLVFPMTRVVSWDHGRAGEAAQRGRFQS